MEPMIFGAWIAAGASFVAAAFAWMSARQARMSAVKVNSVNHQVAAVDRDVDELREALKGFLESTATASDRQGAMILIAHSEILGRCRGADEILGLAASDLGAAIADNALGAREPLGSRFVKVGQAYQDCQQRLADQRLKLLTT
jgi:phosphoenolpyruvate-protein kinase (PTS system EI component)